MKHTIEEIGIDLGDLGERWGYISGELSRDSNNILYCDPNSIKIVVIKDDGSDFDITPFSTWEARKQRATEIEESYEKMFEEEPCALTLAKQKKEEGLCG